MAENPLARCIEILHAAGDQPPPPDQWRELAEALGSLGQTGSANAGATLAAALRPGAAVTTGEGRSAPLDLVMDAIDVGVLAIDGGVVSFANQAAVFLLGQPQEELIGRPLDDVLRVETGRSADDDPKEMSLAHAPPHCQQDARFVRPDGASFDAGYTLASLPEREAGAVLVFRDRTAEKAREQQLRLTQFSVDVAGDAVFWIAPTGRFIYVNEAACARLGYSREELLRMHVYDISATTTREDWPRVSQRVATRGFDVFEVLHQRRDGSTFPVEVNANRVHVDGAEYFCAFARDITDRKRHEEALHAAKASAEAANRAKTEFLANMSHEIRTPMTSILGYAALLLEPGEQEHQRRDYVRTIQRNGEHLLTILNDILDISKIEAGKLTVERIDCSLAAIIADVESLMRVRADEKGLDLTVEFETPVPERLRTDPTRLRQILMNLVGNAVKFTDRGDVRIALGLEAPDLSRDGALRIAVHDTGPGLSREQTARLFQPFSQIDNSTTRRFGGTGLGLAISRRLAGALGGRLDVESEPGRGSVFTLTLATGPLEGVALIQSLSDAESGDAEAAADDRPEPDRLSGRILLAEDGPDNQRLVRHLLCSAGADVEVVGTGAAALERALASRRPGERAFDLILMDMQMPEMDGYDATNALRRAGWTGPILALTAHALAADRDRCLASGCDDHLTKPIQRDRLLAACDEWMSRGVAGAA